MRIFKAPFFPWFAIAIYVGRRKWNFLWAVKEKISGAGAAKVTTLTVPGAL